MGLSKNNVKKPSCPECNIVFSTNQTRNRHIRKFHSGVTIEELRDNHILCPVCKNREPFGTHNNLEKHLEEKHGKKMEKTVLKFVSREEYAKWIAKEKVEVKYHIQRRRKTTSYTAVHYACNRSNCKGYKKNYKVRTEKAGGSIKISGVCPSRYVIKFFKDGEVIANIQRTHVGHTEDLRSQHLSLEEQKIIVDKLKAGITIDQVLQDARNSCNAKLSRMNLLSRQDIHNLLRKHNIDKKRHDISVKNQIMEFHREEIEQFINIEKTNKVSNSKQVKRKTECDHLIRFLDNLDEDTYETVMGKYLAIKKQIEDKKDLPMKERKIEEQTYYLAKRVKIVSVT